MLKFHTKLEVIMIQPMMACSKINMVGEYLRQMKKMRKGKAPKKSGICSMCGEYCAIKVLKDYVRAEH